jgi:metallophosphoesterase superfamily enzyme
MLRIATAEEYRYSDDADIVLLPGRAALLPATQTLVCADLHLGKAATFRRAGLPVPEGSAQQDLKRLADLITTYEARRLIIAGDLFHARAGCTSRVLGEFTDFREQIHKQSNTEVILVLGNHERSLGRHFIPQDLGIDQCVQELVEPPFRFIHEPAATLGIGTNGEATSGRGTRGSRNKSQPSTFRHTEFAGPTGGASATAATTATLFTIAGHLHPTISLRSPSGDRLSGRCFVATHGLLVLPAFGSFTGGHRVNPEPKSKIWFVKDDEVIKICT